MGRNLFIGGTQRHDGMTSVCIGLIESFQQKVGNIGFIKPVGQRDYSAGSYNLNQDSILIEKVCKIHCGLQDMSPITYQKGYPQEDLLRAKPEELERELRLAYDRIERDKDLVLIEGSGHAAVGSLISLSNAKVSAMFGAKVILVTSGASSNPIDNIFLNIAYYEKHGVEVMGVIINKVGRDTPEFLRLYVIDALNRRGIPLLGVLPYEPDLAAPEMSQVLEMLEGRLLNGVGRLNRKVDTVLVGAMSPRRALGYLMDQVCNNLLLITGADRTDLITAAMSADGHGTRGGLVGMILTGGKPPEPSVVRLLEKTRIPVILVNDDTYTSAAKINSMPVRINPTDLPKIERLKTLVRHNVDIGAIEKGLGW